MHISPRRRFAALAVLLAALLLWAAPATAAAPDYSQAANWLVQPAKTAHPVDVFWVYPTVYQGKELVSTIDDQQMRQGAQRTLATQASIFDGLANVFAPMYRQVNMSVLELSPEEQAKHLAVGQQDVRRALAYYLEHLNQGRPFILAGHSQGSNQLVDLLLEQAGAQDLKNMVAAYAIGWSITSDDLKKNPALKICRQAAQTGCVVTYNSVAAGYQKKAPTIRPGAVSVNPLTWTTDGKLAPASLNLGAVFVQDDGSRVTRAHFTSAQNKDGGLVVAPADPSLTPFTGMGPGIYHVYDYSLFYENLRFNAGLRIDAYLHRCPCSH
ncbi:MAG: DUF3089 domain-containing protein [Desulfarculaceae bacterium]|nr:DUF3089 domain-containing protein [Desulfarculaceae bacterium]MCF8074156.1 DUF3089 domain-containing protein [Desulfarculaceae bacterium]MCF8103252.1 DUF3089 domain-containing protein [Desulfarculaceae bacterium]MCF8116890.1 DUF3089 domain-containing protein [Desulfarculaceae bacterium]